MNDRNDQTALIYVNATLAGPLDTAGGRSPRAQLHKAPITVNVASDPEFDVWYVKASNLAGLNVEAKTVDRLIDKLAGAVTDFLEESGRLDRPCHTSAMPSRGVKRLCHSCPRFSHRRGRPRVTFTSAREMPSEPL
jgi:hypothetical protein